MINENDIIVIFNLKIMQFKRDNNANVTKKQLFYYLKDEVWKNNIPIYKTQIINDILEISWSDFSNYLSYASIMKASKMKIDEFNDLIGG